MITVFSRVKLDAHQLPVHRKTRVDLLPLLGRRSTDRVDLVNPLSPFILLPLDPMSVQVREQPVHVVGPKSVAFPLFGVELQEGEIGQIF